MNRAVVYSLRTAMSNLTGNHTMDLLYLLKKNFKKLLSDILITERSFKNLSYLSCCSLSQKWRFWRIHSNVLRGIELELASTKVSVVASQYILWPGSIWYPVRSSMLKNKRIFSLVISALMPVFSTVQLDVAKNHINLNVAKKNSRTLRGVTKSSSALNFEMFAHSTTLISRFSHFMCRAGGFRKLW